MNVEVPDESDEMSDRELEEHRKQVARDYEDSRG